MKYEKFSWFFTQFNIWIKKKSWKQKVITVFNAQFYDHICYFNFFFLRDMLQRVLYLARGRRARKKSDFTLYVRLYSVFSKVIVLLIHAPVHLFPLPVYPGLQVQRYEPIVLLHCAFTWQAEGEELHSLTSAANTKIKSSMKYEKFP